MDVDWKMKTGIPWDPDVDVIDMTKAIWSEASGAGEGCHSPEEIREWIRILAERLDNWRPSPPWAEAYDNAVKTMITEALEFARERRLHE